MRLTIIGNPENRRVTEFQAASVALGESKPRCLAWDTIVREPDILTTIDADLVRIESPGENEIVTREMIRLGGGPADPLLEFGEVNFLREHFRGFRKTLRRIAQTGLQFTIPPAEIEVMFDKWASHQRMASAGIARPESRLAPKTLEEFHAAVAQSKSGAWFLKPLHGSSASGVCAFRWKGDQQLLISPLTFRSSGTRTIFSNSLKVKTYDSAMEIEKVLAHLLPQEMILESWVPKLNLPGGAVDLRVLVIAGEARHWVVRQSQSPMTNLHLGNRRGSPEMLVERIGEDGMQAAFNLAEDAAACFPEALSCGIDILITNGRRPKALVGEVNAFGDLLPNLMHRNQTAYEAVAHACYERARR